MKNFLILVFYFFAIQLHAADKPYQNGSKAYNGLYIFYDQLNKIFPLADVDNSDESIVNFLQNKNFRNATYIIIYRNFRPTNKDLIALKDFIKDGNHVLVVASDFNDNVFDFFKFKNEVEFDALPQLSFKENGLQSLGKFTSNRIQGYTNGFTKIDTSKTQVLGVNDNGKPNFIKAQYGMGTLLIHLYPEVLLNYFLVEKQNYQYTESLLSYVPRNTDRVIVKVSSYNSSNSSYNGQNDSGANMDSMSFIKNDSNLWSAFLLGLLIFGLLVLFGFKRRQRLIPVHEPIKNNTLDFAKTIGDLYFNQKNNADIAYKKITYWQELVRTKYLVPTSKMDAVFWDKLAKKSGASNELLQQLEANVTAVKTNPIVSDYLLIQLSNNIDKFNKI